MNSNKFKTNVCAFLLSLPLDKEDVTKNALVTSILRRGTANLKSQLEINKKLEEMYGASLNVGIYKYSDFEVIQFSIEVINDKFLPEKRELTVEALNLLSDIIFNPYLENGTFCKQYVDQEKKNLAKVIDARSDDKSEYASSRMIEEMFKGEPYGIYKFGTKEAIEKYNEVNLYEYYKKALKKAKLNVYVIGEVNSNVQDKLEENINNLCPSLGEEEFAIENKKHIARKEINFVNESMDISQGKLMVGLDIGYKDEPLKRAKVMLYNTVLGGGANSKLFQNVREKASLAYSAGSKLIRTKDTIMIKTGIEIDNYDKALSIIEKQIEDMRAGNITDKEIADAKQLIKSVIKLIPESAASILNYQFDNDIFNENFKTGEFIDQINSLSKEDILDIAKTVTIDTVYFLRN